MKVITREPIKSIKGSMAGAHYKLDTGHIANIYNYGHSFVYTKSGNYASQPTMQKVFRVISEFESKRIQIQD